MSVSANNLDEATAAEIQKYMEDHGVVDLHMKRERYANKVTGWTVVAKLSTGVQVAGGPFPEMSDAMKFLVHKLEEA